MKSSTRMIATFAILGVLLAGIVYGKGMFLKVQEGGTENPPWLNVTVTHNEANLFNVAIHAKTRKGITGYDVRLTIASGEHKGLHIPVEITKVNHGYTADMALPKSLLSKATLTLSEHLGAEDGSWAADGGSMYAIDLGSYLPKTNEKDTANKPDAGDGK